MKLRSSGFIAKTKYIELNYYFPKYPGDDEYNRKMEIIEIGIGHIYLILSGYALCVFIAFVIMICECVHFRIKNSSAVIHFFLKR